MFHVERNLSSPTYKGIIALLFLFLILNSCGGVRQTIQIPDYILMPEGKEIVGNKSLTAFVFENNLKKLSIEQYLSIKFNSNSYLENEYWITIDRNK